ncbi:MAG TPA: NAD(P)H-hydrate dehydratase [Syntrophales bacterium]|nr:sugar kinase [Syntrophobacterales bacterium]HNQ01946.1 NAD(P)H-hydrate dehydratase [Syntrophales bacterium]HQL90436.1 NAD(P)H-hydrate dehydratase [Syntrophales bacterium]
MLLVCGTAPLKELPLTEGEARLDGDLLRVGRAGIPCTQGTAALVSAACKTLDYLGHPAPRVLLVGDDGSGKGSRQLYERLIADLPRLAPRVVVLHYMLPVMGLMRKVSESASKAKKRPFMIADAAAMYAAKAAGIAREFDLFTPDLSELAFLADPQATHPAYVSRHLFESDSSRIPEMVAAAYANGSAARTLVVKGATDHIAQEGGILDTLSEPDIPALEAIGGTGDTISGMVGALVHAGYDEVTAARVAIRANRTAGLYAGATPATRIRQVIEALPRVLADHLDEWVRQAQIEREERSAS